jgi:protein disulfide-isomerase
MKKLLLVAIAIILIAYFAWPSGAHNDGLTWLTDMSTAQTTAKKLDRPIFVYFTGSDWCGWCKKLDAEILSHVEFHNYAAKHLVLLKLDFPRHTAQPPEVASANRSLARKFGIRGFPTVIMLDKNGNELGRTGYQAVTPAQYVSYLDHFVSAN